MKKILIVDDRTDILETETAQIPVIRISASHDLNLTSQEDGQADDFIAKPFEIDALLQKVNSINEQYNLNLVFKLY